MANLSRSTKTHKLPIILGTLFLALSPGAARASIIVYGNTTLDVNAGLDLMGFYDAVGDGTVLSDSDYLATGARVAIYNVGSQGTADVTLQFYQTGTPVGATIGSPYTMTGVDLLDNALTLVDFSLGGLAVPSELVFMVTVSNVAVGVIPQLELFGPSPEAGSNTADTAIVANGLAFSQADTSGVGGGNPYFELTAEPAAVPEPSSWLLLATGTGGLLAFGKRRKLSLKR
jgi:hypothetical protein